MTKKQIEAMVRDIVGAVDYDHAKNLDPKTAEEPKHARKELARLVSVAEDHMRRAVPKRSTDR